MPLFPAISQIVDEPRILPAYNNSGGARVEGDVLCWEILTTARLHVQTPSAVNRYRPAGVVTEDGIPSAANGWLYAGSGGPINVKVLGHASIGIGTPLQVVNGQHYLAIIASPVEGVRYAFTAAEAYTTTSVAVKLVLIDLSLV